MVGVYEKGTIPLYCSWFRKLRVQISCLGFRMCFNIRQRSKKELLGNDDFSELYTQDTG